MAIFIGDVKKVAALARLKLTAEEEQKYTADLAAVLDYVDKLKTLQGQPAQAQFDNLQSVADLRADKQDGGRRQAEILTLAPTRQGNYLSVPAVF